MTHGEGTSFVVVVVVVFVFFFFRYTVGFRNDGALSCLLGSSGMHSHKQVNEASHRPPED